MKSLIWLLLFLVLTGLTRCYNFEEVFVDGGIYFVDADCYARMTRVRMVLESPTRIIRLHEFENFPTGTTPHTTAPMDYLIAALAVSLQPFSARNVDLAGALISPLLGLATTAALWVWSRQLLQRFRRSMLLLVSLSPVLVHGTLLGRPDHQSLLIFLMALAVGAELAIVRMPSRAWSFVAGGAWGLALWVSLYEPAILFLAVNIGAFMFFRQSFLARERWIGYSLLPAIFCAGLLIDGWRISIPDEETLSYFRSWRLTIGELSPVGLLSPILFRWVGFGLLLAPILLLARLRDARRSAILLLLLTVTFALTMYQVRWGYFFALVFAMSLPWQLSFFKKPWLVWSLFVLSLWPVLREWEERVFPDEQARTLLAEARYENVLLRDAAEYLRESGSGAILAPWWLSPALVYWSGRPAVAGSSHESLPGTLDSARFFLSKEPSETLLRKRNVESVVAYDATRVGETSAIMLRQTLPKVTTARILYERPHSAPEFLRLSYANPAFKVFEVAGDD